MNTIRCLRPRNAFLYCTPSLARQSTAVCRRALPLRLLSTKPKLRPSKPATAPQRDALTPSLAPKNEGRNSEQKEKEQEQDRKEEPEEEPEKPNPRNRFLAALQSICIRISRRVVPNGIASLRDVRRGIVLFLTWFLLGHYIASHHYSITLPRGASMLPTMHYTGEIVLISKHYRHGAGIKVGDVICALHPWFPDGQAVIKRVVGMPGDFVWVPEGRPAEMEWEFGREGEGHYVQVPRGHCWINGDNQGQSRDSRYYGAVPLGLVTGKVVVRLWPILPYSRWGRFGNGLEEVEEGVLE